MLEKVLRFFIVFTFIIAGGALFRLATPLMAQLIQTELFNVDLGIFELTFAGSVCILIGVLIGGVGGWFVSPFLIRKLGNFTSFVEKQISKMPVNDVIAGAVGLSIGLIIADLLGNAFARIPVVGNYISIALSIALGYIGIRLTITKRKELTRSLEIIPRLLREILRNRESKDKDEVKDEKAEVKAESEPTAQIIEAEPESEPPVEESNPLADLELIQKDEESDKNYKLLDTNVIIDGRIADICKTGFLEGRLLIPVFVLEELQHIADSPDSLRRVRGRRGLDVLQKIREDSPLEVEIMNVDFDDIHEVDSKLVRLAQKLHGKIITNDFNLNKVAQLRGVEVLNINDLSNAVKAVVIPGETMRVQVVRDGKEPGQGVAYLDDGTMIVIENGHRYLSRTISVEVTSALQTSAGRMIFAKPR